MDPGPAGRLIWFWALLTGDGPAGQFARLKSGPPSQDWNGQGSQASRGRNGGREQAFHGQDPECSLAR
jgi:hypothetical protein